MTSFILPGAAVLPEQLLEGWEPAAPDGYRPIEFRCRTLLAVPAGRKQRLFLSLYFPPLDPFPASAFSVKVNDCLLETVGVTRAGDHRFEWGLPPGLDAESRAVVSLEFDSRKNPRLPWIRSMGLVASDAADENLNAQPWELEEAITWNRELEAHLALLQGQLEECHRRLRETRDDPRRQDPPH